ncbi:unnamed protein product [Microthlaspi erraticum]|uniref:Uncharacterized protein n=1 Tax=Microthlaspi erraticum TaxID=1685480 RepID=A0A6D2JTN8_9BRAS|nr:unnamed protein product [Microthlaspi erraticum]
MYMVKGAAYAHTVPEYDRYMDLIRAANPALAAYLEKADPKLWSRVHFEGDRYNIKTSNIAESINSAVKKAKGLPIPRLLEFIREKLGRWFSKRREDALSLTTIHSRGVEYILAIRSYYAGSMIVDRIDTWRFHVKGGNEIVMSTWRIEHARAVCITLKKSLALMLLQLQPKLTSTCPITYAPLIRAFLVLNICTSAIPQSGN